MPPVVELEEPPEKLVDPSTTVEHRVELKIAAAPGTATESPETPDLAPAPADTEAEDVLVSGAVDEAPTELEVLAEPETVESAPESVQSPEGPLPGEDAELQEVDIAVLPDTGGAAKLSGVSLAPMSARPV